jgi:hypothetical protein
MADSNTTHNGAQSSRRATGETTSKNSHNQVGATARALDELPFTDRMRIDQSTIKNS